MSSGGRWEGEVIRWLHLGSPVSMCKVETLVFKLIPWEFFENLGILSLFWRSYLLSHVHYLEDCFQKVIFISNFIVTFNSKQNYQSKPAKAKMIQSNSGISKGWFQTKNYESYYRSERLQVWTIWSILNHCLYISQSILSISVYLGLFWPILTFTFCMTFSNIIQNWTIFVKEAFWFDV